MTAVSSHPSRRRFLGRALLAPAAGLTFALTGCGGLRDLDLATAEPAAAPATSSPPPEPPASVAPAEPARPAAVELTIRWNGLDPAGQAAALDFASGLWAGDAIRVTPDFTDWASSYGKISAGLADGSAPDIWQAGGLWTALLAAKGGTLFLDDFVNGWSEWDDFYPSAVDDVTYDNRIHGLPYRVNLRSPVIRPGMFEAVGLEPKIPDTWDELNAVAPQMTFRDGDDWEQVGFNQFTGSMEWNAWLLEAGPLHEPGTSPPKINRAALDATLRQYLHFVADGVMPVGGFDPEIFNLHPYCAGSAAIMRLWSGDLANCELNEIGVFADSAAGLPWLGPSGQRVTQVYVDKYMAYRLTKSPAAVYTALERLSDLDVNHAINVETRRSLPCRVAMESYPIFSVSPWREFAHNTRYAVPQATVDEHFDWFPRLGPWIENAAAGEITIQEALDGIMTGRSTTVTG